LNVNNQLLRSRPEPLPPDRIFLGIRSESESSEQEMRDLLWKRKQQLVLLLSSRQEFVLQSPDSS